MLPIPPPLTWGAIETSKSMQGDWPGWLHTMVLPSRAPGRLMARRGQAQRIPGLPGGLRGYEPEPKSAYTT